MNEVKRDLTADLRICEVASPGPWAVYASYYGSMRYDVRGKGVDLRLFKETDAVFISEARTGWPAAIQRALAAEERLKKAEAELRTRPHVMYSEDSRYERIALKQTDEVQRLRSLLIRASGYVPPGETADDIQAYFDGRAGE